MAAKPVSVLLLLVCFAWNASAQIGGKQAFSYLNLPVGAKMAAIGGINVSAQDRDVNMMYANPALLNEKTDRQLSFSFTDYVSDIRQNSLTYSFNHEKLGRWGVGLNYMNYGDFVERDATGQELGTFSVTDYNLNITHATTIDNYTLGATAKLAVSSIAENTSVAGLVDLGGTFKHPERDFVIGLALKNIGYQFITYTETGERQPMPFDAQLGMSYKLEHMPLRFSLTAHHLHQWDIVYLDPNKKTNVLDPNNEEVKEEKKFFDQLARHMVVGGEFVFSDNFNLRFGYNHLRRKEMRMDVKSGAAGFSMGAMLRIRSIQLDYSRAWYHLAGAANYFSVSTNLNSIFKSKSPQG